MISKGNKNLGHLITILLRLLVVILILGCLSSNVSYTVDIHTDNGLKPININGIADINPKNPQVKPVFPMKQKTQCVTMGQLSGSDFKILPPASRVLNLRKLKAYGDGDGVIVAVIDSGVTPNPRLKNIIPGGDFLTEGGDGLQDCDGHGTLIAGIIAGQKSKKDSFEGIAPKSRIISIRQSSKVYVPKEEGKSSSTLDTVAIGIQKAVLMGAKVINLSITSCYPIKEFKDSELLAETLKWAVIKKDTIVITSAGNANETCEANPGYSGDSGSDYRNWSGTKTVSLPSYFAPLVLSVGGTSLRGSMYANTLTGPWVSLATVAENVVSLSPDGKGTLVNAYVTDKGVIPIAGTSFASGYVSGIMAIARQRFKYLTAIELMNKARISVRNQSEVFLNGLGSGIFDPIRFLGEENIKNVINNNSNPYGENRDELGRWVKSIHKIDNDNSEPANQPMIQNVFNSIVFYSKYKITKIIVITIMFVFILISFIKKRI